MSDRRQPTTTSAFGVSGRSNHDARDFYARFTPPELSDESAVQPPLETDVIVTGDARDMTRVASGRPGIWIDICSENQVAIIGADGERIGPLPVDVEVRPGAVRMLLPKDCDTGSG